MRGRRRRREPPHAWIHTSHGHGEPITSCRRNTPQPVFVANLDDEFAAFFVWLFQNLFHT
jgi:hypothetical protein